MGFIRAPLYLFAALCVFGYDDNTVFVQSQELDLLLKPAHDETLCSSHSKCEKLDGACCPTPDGVQLACCDEPKGPKGPHHDQEEEEEEPADAADEIEVESEIIPDVADGLHGLQPLMGDANTNSLNNKKCKRFFTTTEEGEVLAWINRKNGKTEIVDKFSGTQVFTLEHNFYNGVLYGIRTKSNNDSILVEVDPRNAKLTRVGDMGVKQAIGLAAAGNQGSMYTYSRNSEKFFEIDPRTGEAYERSNTKTKNIIDLAYSIKEGVIYATNGKDLFTINPFDGSTSKEGKIKDLPNGVSLSGLAITPNGNTLYGLTDDVVGAEIWEINPKNLKAKLDTESVLRDPAIGGTLLCKNNKVPDNF